MQSCDVDDRLIVRNLSVSSPFGGLPRLVIKPSDNWTRPMDKFRTFGLDWTCADDSRQTQGYSRHMDNISKMQQAVPIDCSNSVVVKSNTFIESTCRYYNASLQGWIEEVNSLSKICKSHRIGFWIRIGTYVGFISLRVGLFSNLFRSRLTMTFSPSRVFLPIFCIALRTAISDLYWTKAKPFLLTSEIPTHSKISFSSGPNRMHDPGMRSGHRSHYANDSASNGTHVYDSTWNWEQPLSSWATHQW